MIMIKSISSISAIGNPRVCPKSCLVSGSAAVFRMIRNKYSIRTHFAFAPKSDGKCLNIEIIQIANTKISS